MTRSIVSLPLQSVSEEEDRDQFSMEITVTDPKKMGDGMNAYIAYRVNTKVGDNKTRPNARLGPP